MDQKDESKEDAKEKHEQDESQSEAQKQTAECEEQKEDESSSSWNWYSVLKTAKQKSSEAYQFMKRDLTEFKDTVQQDTVSAVSSTADYIRKAITAISIDEDENSPKEEKTDESGDVAASSGESDKTENPSSFEFIEEKAKNFISSVFEVFKGATYSIDDEEICVLAGNKIVTIPLQRWNLLLSAVQNDPETYCEEPRGPSDDLEAWVATFKLSDHEAEVKQLLSTVPEVSNFYSKLVPNTITHEEFWKRYFYRVHQLLILEEMRKEKLNLKLQEQLENVDVAEPSKEKPKVTKNDNSDSENCSKLTTKESGDLVVVKRKGDESSSSSPSDATKTSEASEDWEKAELSEIVDETTKRLAEKLKTCTDKPTAEEYNDWEWQ